MPIHILDGGKNASFTADERIFLGEGLFETIRVEQQQPCYSSLHWQRLRQSAVILGIPFDLSVEAWHVQLMNCIQAANMDAGGVKVILSGGRAPRGLVTRSNNSSLVFQAFTYEPERGALNLVSAPWRRDAQNPIYQLKSVNYLESIWARRQAIACGADEALFFNLADQATETTVANLFLVKQSQILTPELTNGVLAGITRGRLIDVCKDSGIACLETPVNRANIHDADAVFVTNALQGIRSVKSFDGSIFSVSHPMVAHLQHLLATDQQIFNQA